ncbi:Ig-like domain-containing protein [Dysosmobacter sp.]|uniref:Ig-like domain-containing protein n=1 Tax=Dysosmobacter sp. TaxID=2591382 RepID=UPI002A880718|nr:Ig-like domain-containing protein [Dysosmobacter sp.]MDY3282423.1 Ig-like domain-containing protein [Dysosmobacter sp.]
MNGKSMALRGAALAAAMLVLVTPATALFGGADSAAASAAEEGAPIARELEIRTYRNIPYRAQFLSQTADGGEVTYQVERQPKRGTVTVKGDTFTYTPEKNRTGKDSFTYVVTDSAGRVSRPAAVTVTVEKAKSGVSYADMADNDAAAAAQWLAEAGVFTGGKIGEQYFFEPDRTVSRSEFLSMTLETAGRPVTEVTMTGFCDDEAIPTWAKSYAAAGLSDGVVQGSATAGGVAFRGGDAITFNEAAAILNRILSVNDVDLTAWYGHRDAAPSWAAQAVGNMEAVSVLAAGSFGSPALNNCVTRADMARMLCSAGVLLEGEPAGLLDWII